MQIDLDDLRLVTEKLFARLEALDVAAVELSADYYWCIPSPDMYDVAGEPQELDLGQLTCDWLTLSKVLQGGVDPLPVHFIRLAAILRAVGEAAPA